MDIKDISSEKEKVLICWVAQFLNYWEDESMLYGKAAKIIVNEIIQTLSLYAEGKDIDQMPDVASFFPD